MEKTPNKDILCGPCRNLIANGSSPYYPPRGTTTTRVYDMKEEEHEPATSGHHLNFEAFTRSAASGCRVCSLLITQLTPWQRREMLRHNHMSDAKLSCSYISGHGKHPLVEVAYFMPPKTDGEKLEKVWLKLPLTETRGQERLQDERCSADSSQRIHVPSAILELKQRDRHCGL